MAFPEFMPFLCFDEAGKHDYSRERQYRLADSRL